MELSNCLPETPDSRAMSKEYTLRQARMTNELQELNKLLEKKEILAKQMVQNDDQMKEIRGQYEVGVKCYQKKSSLFMPPRQKFVVSCSRLLDVGVIKFYSCPYYITSCIWFPLNNFSPP